MSSEDQILKAIWKLNFEKGAATEEDLGEFKEDLPQLLREGLVERIDSGYCLSKSGRKKIKVVACGGVFDILHPGHGFILEKAKELGNLLVVVVARDSTVMKRKRIPIVPEKQRLEMVRYLKPVDVASLGEESDYLKIMERIAPDVIVLGPDQHHNEELIRKELEKRGLKVEVVRIEEYKEAPLHSTGDILKKIMEQGYPK
ncbi:MAG: adenylyltransferase/cytidyltransferase family protein [Candidatus Hydrothermarchaeales archaeon]